MSEPLRICSQQNPFILEGPKVSKQYTILGLTQWVPPTLFIAKSPVQSKLS